MFEEKISSLAEKHLPEMIRIRRQIHMHPELGFQEFKTAALVAETLKSLGIEVTEGVAKTGVVGLIRGGKPGKTVLLRADMDALELTEEADVDYKSTVPGVMHACGHDGHTAGLLGAAMILNEIKDQLCGNVKLMFQPAEEKEGGAEPMIQEGILENPKVDAAFGCHVKGTLEGGKVWVKGGPTMAAPDEFTFTVIGRGGHAASPHQNVDAVVIAAQVIMGLQTIVSRRLDPVQPAVISCCKINGGHTHNVMPDTVQVTGTIRTLDPDVRVWIKEEMERTIKGITEANGADYKLEVTLRYPPLINDEAMTAFARKSIEKMVGAENVTVMKNPVMGAEDFAYVAQAVPSSYFYVGVMKDEPAIGHNTKFKWDDSNLAVSSKCLAQIAADFLNEQDA